jgi:hypothetical protein
MNREQLTKQREHFQWMLANNNLSDKHRAWIETRLWAIELELEGSNA